MLFRPLNYGQVCNIEAVVVELVLWDHEALINNNGDPAGQKAIEKSDPLLPSTTQINLHFPFLEWLKSNFSLSDLRELNLFSYN